MPKTKAHSFNGEFLLRRLHIDSLVEGGFDLVFGADQSFLYMCDWPDSKSHICNIQRLSRHFGFSLEVFMSKYGFSKHEGRIIQNQTKNTPNNNHGIGDSQKGDYDTGDKRTGEPKEATASDCSENYIEKEGQDSLVVPYIKGENPIIDMALEQLLQYLGGKLLEFDLPLHPIGSEFQQRVWKSLTHIPYGKTVTYGQLANELGLRKGYQAVGSAIGTNPISIIIPCHRVLSHCSLGGYAAGLEIKKALLSMEQPTGDLFGI